MVTAIDPIQASMQIETVSAVNEAQARVHDTARYVDTLESIQNTERTTKPILESTFYCSNASPAMIFAKMMDTIQKYVKSTSATAELKQEQVGRNIQKAEAKLREVQKQALEAKQSADTWNTRHMVANCMLNGVSALTGIGLTVAGNPWTGGSLIFSGVGGIASELMKHYGWNSTLTAATSLVSGAVGILGGLGSGLGQLFRGPSLFMGRLTSNPVTTALQATGALTSLFATGLSGYAMVEKNKTAALLAEIDALHTQTETSLRLLQQKYTSASTAFQGTVKNFSGLFKTIAKTQTRYTRDCLRMLTAEFPA